MINIIGLACRIKNERILTDNWRALLSGILVYIESTGTVDEIARASLRRITLRSTKKGTNYGKADI